ncbi:DeoR/GlpR family DNA-binding transcription regulator [Pantoea rwandensis]|uniref:DeoR family transcriptional regulator n=1 Tax=Pantoea rwandensis TaxID=1076550 RepID=A0A1X1D673_9GAMM|nr:DeoR/GlpR family DNA-binding transcription regulator [Pantoea rwandensis]ORM72185.1 DeoR family transcriptional regulator [Pantoea rwandensis]
MHKTARQKLLMELLLKEGQAGIGELVDKLQVSADTVRRDLAFLEKKGLAQKNHGGAVALDLSVMSRHERSTLIPDVKVNLGTLVAEKIPSGCTLFLDAGSTVLAVAAMLKGPATVITTSLDIAYHLSDKPDIELILLGGKWDKQQRLFSGSATMSLLNNYRADIAILGACALHPRFGLSASQEGDAEIKRAMLAASNEHWVVADHMKLNRCEPYLVASLTNIHQLFLDSPWNELEEAGSTQITITH